MSFWRWLLALMFFIHENNYYGWNAMPHSDAELLADGISFLLFSLALRRGRRP